MGIHSMCVDLCGTKTPNVYARAMQARGLAPFYVAISTRDLLLTVNADSLDDLVALGQQIIEAASKLEPKDVPQEVGI